MNLYGDYANVLAVKRTLEVDGEEVTVDKLSLGDYADWSKYDFIFIGSGTEKNQKVVLNDFRKYKEQIAAYIGAGKVLLMTGNSFEMLGKSITDGDGKLHEGLGLYDFTVTEERGKRYTSDIIATAGFLKQPLVGFINKSGMIYGVRNPMDTVTFGIGNNADEMTEGICDRHFYGTHITGPVLMKNPHFLLHIAEQIMICKPTDVHLVYEKKGYENTLRKLSERKE
jgi:hypothetical protein